MADSQNVRVCTVCMNRSMISISQASTSTAGSWLKSSSAPRQQRASNRGLHGPRTAIRSRPAGATRAESVPAAVGRRRRPKAADLRLQGPSTQPALQCSQTRARHWQQRRRSHSRAAGVPCNGVTDAHCGCIAHAPLGHPSELTQARWRILCPRANAPKLPPMSSMKNTFLGVQY